MSDGVAIETLSSTPVDSGFPAQGAVERPPFRAKTSFVVLCCAIVFYLALCYSLLHGELRATGTMTFPLDDTYITMSLAKKFAAHGVWGLEREGFQSSTSTPGFVLLLAASYRALGPSEWLPLAFSLLFGLCSIFAAQRLMAKEHLAVQVAGLLAFVFFTPLHAIGVLGMEHTLHLALALLFLAAFSRVYAEQKFPGWGLLLLTALMVSVRYEGLFFAAGAALLLMLERRVGAAFAVGAAAFVPVVGYGIISVMHGCDWLPHSIALKGISGKAASHSPVELLRHCATMLERAPYLGALLGIVAVLLMIGTVRADRRRRSTE